MGSWLQLGSPAVPGNRPAGQRARKPGRCLASADGFDGIDCINMFPQSILIPSNRHFPTESGRENYSAGKLLTYSSGS